MTKRIFQTSIKAATRELAEQELKAMMQNPKNNELIDIYRDLKRQMEEAEMRHTLSELVKTVLETEEYKKWLAAELKKDERRSQKRVPTDNLQRVKLFIGHHKSSLPAVILTVSHFSESKDRFGRTGLWRVQSNGYLSGLVVADFDHVPNPEEHIKEWL